MVAFVLILNSVRYYRPAATIARFIFRKKDIIKTDIMAS